jgi:hypothetical protein
LLGVILGLAEDLLHLNRLQMPGISPSMTKEKLADLSAVRQRSPNEDLCPAFS